ncbi:MAG: PrsW family intramembrane metalloprotease [Spirochaetia bacterium]
MLAAILIIDVLVLVIYSNILLVVNKEKINKKTETNIARFLAAGLASVVVAIYLEWFLIPDRIFYSDLLLMDFVKHIVFVGPIEEFSKFTCFYIMAKYYRTVEEPMDAMVQGAATALGFAVIENFLYAASYGIFVLIIRSILSIIGHMSYAMVWGYAYGSLRYYSKKPIKGLYFVMLLYILPAAFIHGLFNFTLNYSFFLSVMIKVIVFLVFFNLYKKLEKKSPFRHYPLKQYKKAIEIIKHIIRREPNNLSLLYRLFIYAMYGKKYVLAGQVVDHSFCLLDTPYLHCLRGIVKMVNSDPRIQQAGEREYLTSHQQLNKQQKARLRLLIKKVAPELDSPNMDK